MPIFLIPTYFSHIPKKGEVSSVFCNVLISKNTAFPARKGIWDAVIKRASLNSYEFISP